MSVKDSPLQGSWLASILPALIWTTLAVLNALTYIQKGKALYLVVSIGSGVMAVHFLARLIGRIRSTARAA